MGIFSFIINNPQDTDDGWHDGLYLQMSWWNVDLNNVLFPVPLGLMNREEAVEGKRALPRTRVFMINLSVFLTVFVVWAVNVHTFPTHHNICLRGNNL